MGFISQLNLISKVLSYVCEGLLNKPNGFLPSFDILL